MITLEQVKAAYSATGLGVVRVGEGWISDNCQRACALTAVCASKGMSLAAFRVDMNYLEEKELRACVAAVIGESPEWVEAFIVGFDGLDWIRDKPRSAWELGNAIRNGLAEAVRFQ